MTANRTPNLPIRTFDGLEVPITGAWPIMRSSSVTTSNGGHGSARGLHVLGGRLEIAADPVDSSLQIALDRSTVIATAAQIDPDRHGMSEWRFEGIVETADGHDPVDLTLSYHGVFRRGIEAWAWMSGTGAIHTRSRRRGLRPARPGDQFVFDLLFTAPDVTRIPRIEPRARAERLDSHVMQLPRLGSQPTVFALDTRASRHSLA